MREDDYSPPRTGPSPAEALSVAPAGGEHQLAPRAAITEPAASAERALHIEVVNRYFDAVDAEDWESLADVLHRDVELTACGARPRSGSEAVMAMFRKVFQRFPAHSDRPTRLIVEGGTVVAEIHFEGTSETGVEISFEAVDVFDLRDGRIIRIAQWFDSAALERSLSAAD